MRLIDADALEVEVGQVDYEYFKNTFGLLIPYYYAPSIQKLIDKQPIIDAELVVHAHWEPSYEIIEYDWDGETKLPEPKKFQNGWNCSECGNYQCGISIYCPHCGAKMDEKVDDA